MLKKKLCLVLTCGLGLALLLAACGGEEKGEPTAAAKPPATTAPGTTSAATKAPDATKPAGTPGAVTAAQYLNDPEFNKYPKKLQDMYKKYIPLNLKKPDPYKPIYGGTMVVSFGTSMGKNFAKASQPGAMNTWRLVSSGLIIRPYNWGDNTYVENYKPDLAESWSVNKDATEWTFKLRNDVTWSDQPPVNGRKFTAQDVVWWLTTLRDNAWYGDELAEIKSVEAPDERTVVIKTSRPMSDLLSFLALSDSVLFPKECWDNEQSCMEGNPVGLGAFVSTSWNETKRSFKRNPKFYMKDDEGNQLPYLDGIDYIPIADPAAAQAALKTGKVDYTGTASVLDTALRMRDEFGMRMEMTGPAGANFVQNDAISFNFKNDGPWKDKRVRQALSMALDRDRICDVAYGGMCGLRMPVLETDLGKKFPFTISELPKTFQYNPEQAKKLLADAGYANGFTITLQTPTGQSGLGSLATWNEVVKDWNAIGVKADLKPIADAYLLLSKKEFPAALGACCSPIGQRRFLRPWRMLRTGSAANAGNYSNPDLDRVLDEWRDTPVAAQPDKHRQLSEQIMQIFGDEVPRIDVITTFRWELSQQWVINQICSGYGGLSCGTLHNPTWTKAWIDPSVKGLPEDRKFTPRTKP